MKVHPAPGKCNIARRYGVAAVANTCRQRKLRRLPHIFAKVLELPFDSEADVSVIETADSLIFTVATGDMSGDVRADAVEIYPGVTKIVVRGSDVVDLSGMELELDLWRFRLPDLMRPELASAAYEDGELVVTVPKGPTEVEEDDAGGEDDDIGGGNFVLVQ
ncbi:uncharacterized protein LOC127244146 [Andrographis paniculata]|uniref:uncharacterized protein LOC127244146 n=1 Tax=Andrographis paniculata TaxID=175694 RepID=UPI0021E70C3B|nr:uncharacterized protein LOC127244146 [Andrographis paniculata]XP_051120468.1 uncharacterized protein LOC127244146 [Andrographis paniculata]XP_051120469.1 uncharacterized protein LOC127244146 [Andrographis paniculata]XP_051120470.1 uncharacterized protein LOC127244146 [Andrographis paniculata]XP_051120471.1 uncharacterized protein LOC127244146 [Andrographis paniculata]XP_051120472.1 uncharacterized protein LOC127244146 [Andrographis paniculata]XP_051120473.1 uncharacterized protein LOC12724